MNVYIPAFFFFRWHGNVSLYCLFVSCDTYCSTKKDERKRFVMAVVTLFVEHSCYTATLKWYMSYVFPLAYELYTDARAAFGVNSGKTFATKMKNR